MTIRTNIYVDIGQRRFRLGQRVMREGQVIRGKELFVITSKLLAPELTVKKDHLVGSGLTFENAWKFREGKRVKRVPVRVGPEQMNARGSQLDTETKIGPLTFRSIIRHERG